MLVFCTDRLRLYFFTCCTGMDMMPMGGRGGFGGVQGHFNPAFMGNQGGAQGQFVGPDGPRKRYRQDDGQ